MATLKVPPNNLYSTGFLVTLLDGTTILKRNKVVYKKSQTRDQLYTIKEGDTLPNLAYTMYGDSKKWFIIADVNPELINPFDLTPGTKVIIPDIELITLQTS